MKKISQYLLTISILLIIPAQASISVLTNGLPRHYRMEGESKLLLGKEEIKIKAGEMTFEGADLKRGSFTFIENNKNWKKISYKEGKLETSGGTFFVKGFLQQGKNKLEIIMRIYLEPIEKGFKMEVRYLSLDSKRKNSKFPINDFKGVFKGVKKDPS